MSKMVTLVEGDPICKRIVFWQIYSKTSLKHSYLTQRII